jgi:hypothetical protein
MQSSRVDSFKLCAAVVISVALFLGAKPLRAQDSMHKRVVVIGSPKSVKFLGSASKALPGDEIRIANEYAVVLERVTRIAGDTEVPSRLSLKLLAANAENIPKGALIYVALDVDSDTFDVKYWDIVRQTICIPRELVKDAPLAEEVDLSIEGDKSCMSFDSGR